MHILSTFFLLCLFSLLVPFPFSLLSLLVASIYFVAVSRPEFSVAEHDGAKFEEKYKGFEEI